MSSGLPMPVKTPPRALPISLAARLLAGLGLVLLVLAGGVRPGSAGAQDLPSAFAARVAGDEDRTRFVADVSAPLGFTAYVLSDPHRVVIDLPQLTFDLPPQAGGEGRGLVSAFRFGPLAEGRSRIVLDTTGPVLIEKSFLKEPEAGQPARIVVDLVHTTPEKFAAQIKADERAALVQTLGAAVPKPRPKPGSEAVASETAGGAVQARRDGRRLVVIDPGHGGIDPGAIGQSKTREKDVVLAFGLKLQQALEASGTMDVVMTRSTDQFVSLRDRVRVARENQADLFIAIHADTVRGPEARGATIYTLSETASDAEAAALAHKENRADIIAGVHLETESEEVTDILIDLVQRESKTHALVFAKKAVAEMSPETDFTGKPMRSAGFVVLKAPDVPSVLVELGYLSSRRDEKQLNDPAWRERVARAMARAIQKYFARQMAAKSP
jgi:N-acetylmuramoyl-L-alanine amidase